MKKYLLILFCIPLFGQVPNTNTFSLQDVKTEVEKGCECDIESLIGSFEVSFEDGFDPTYKGSKDRQNNFRNYESPEFTAIPKIHGWPYQDLYEVEDCNGDGIDESPQGDVYWICSTVCEGTIYVKNGETFLSADKIYVKSPVVNGTGDKFIAYKGYLSDENVIRHFDSNGDFVENFNCGEPKTSIDLGFSGTESGACSDFSTNPNQLYINNGATFVGATELFINEYGSTYADSGYYSDGNRVRFWNGTAFTSSVFCSTL